MPFCGFNTKMVTGLTIFAEGLFAATLERAQSKGISIEEAFKEEVNELGLFLETLEQQYQQAKAANTTSARDAMSAIADRIADSDRRRSQP